MQEGLLFEYNRLPRHLPLSGGSIHVGGDASGNLPRNADGNFDPEPGANGGLGPPRARSYNMSLSVNGYPALMILHLQPMSRCSANSLPSKTPIPTSAWSLLMSNEYTLIDSQFGMPTDYFQVARRSRGGTSPPTGIVREVIFRLRTAMWSIGSGRWRYSMVGNLKDPIHLRKR